MQTSLTHSVVGGYRVTYSVDNRVLRVRVRDGASPSMEAVALELHDAPRPPVIIGGSGPPVAVGTCGGTQVFAVTIAPLQLCAARVPPGAAALQRNADNALCAVDMPSGTVTALEFVEIHSVPPRHLTA